MQTNLSMFTDYDQESAKREIDCYGHLLKESIKHMANGEFKKASIYHQNIMRSLEELDRMKNTKEMNDKAWLLLQQIEGSRQHRDLLRRLRA